VDLLLANRTAPVQKQPRLVVVGTNGHHIALYQSEKGATMFKRLSAAALLAVSLTALVLAQTASAPSNNDRAWDMPALPWNLQNWLQAFSWVFAAVGAVGAASSAIWGIRKGRKELKLNRIQREEELKWKRAQAAKDLNDKMLADPSALNARLMIDYQSGRDFMLPGASSPITIATKDVVQALTQRHSPGTIVPALDRFIRDAFDELLYQMGILEHYISRELIEFEDIRHPIDYYVHRMKEVGLQVPVQDYIEHYHFYRTKLFLQRFPEW
jgi:hypothetical protein